MGEEVEGRLGRHSRHADLGCQHSGVHAGSSGDDTLGFHQAALAAGTRAAGGQHR